MPVELVREVAVQIDAVRIAAADRVGKGLAVAFLERKRYKIIGPMWCRVPRAEREEEICTGTKMYTDKEEQSAVRVKGSLSFVPRSES